MENFAGEAKSRWSLSRHTHIPNYFQQMALDLEPHALVLRESIQFENLITTKKKTVKKTGVTPLENLVIYHGNITF